MVIGIVAFFYLTDRPSEAPGSATEEKQLARPRRSPASAGRSRPSTAVGMLRSFFDPKVLLLSLNYIGIVTASLGLLLFLPQIIKQLGVTNMQVGWVTMIPYICGAISMVVCGWISDRVGDRRWSLFTTCVISVVGLVFAGLTVGTWWSLVGIVDRRDRLLWHQGSVLVDAVDVSDRPRGRRRHRLDQFARQSRRLFRPDDRWLGQAADRQLCRRACMRWRSALRSRRWFRLFGLNLRSRVGLPEVAPRSSPSKTLPPAAARRVVRPPAAAGWRGRELRSAWAFAHRLSTAEGWSGNEVRIDPANPARIGLSRARRRPGPDDTQHSRTMP